jgi:hypothetical protein
MTEFYDSARWGLIPAKADALLYYDGRYAATHADAKRFTAVRWITVLGGATAAPHAGAIDYEQGNLAYEGSQLADWVLARKAMNTRARVYCSRADAAKAHALVGGQPNVVYWLATLDGDSSWTAAKMSANLAHGDGGAVTPVSIPASRIWGIQWKGGPTAPFDESTLCSAW